MISKKLITFTFLPIIIFVLYLFALPVKAIAQVGCCQNPAGNCVPGQSNDGSGHPPQTGNQADCEDSINGTGIWFAGVICVPGNDCPGAPPTGCCVHGDNDCTDDVTDADCPDDWVEGTACDDIPQCNIPPPPGEGCCVHGPEDCTDGVTDADCADDFHEGVLCQDIPECNPTPPPGEGCCVIGTNNCVDDQTQDECQLDLDGIDFVEGTNCDFVPECNVPTPIPARPIPTLGQWGMIGMAGLLGIFSLILLNRRRGYKQM